MHKDLKKEQNEALIQILASLPYLLAVQIVIIWVLHVFGILSVINKLLQ